MPVICSVFYNQIDGAPLTKELMAPYRLYNTGETYFSQSIRSSFLCPLDASYFPFDEHVCSLKFGPWTYNTEECDVEGTIAHFFGSCLVDFFETRNTIDDFSR